VLPFRLACNSCFFGTRPEKPLRSTIPVSVGDYRPMHVSRMSLLERCVGDQALSDGLPSVSFI
jgi:hypothetical protein